MSNLPEEAERSVGGELPKCSHSTLCLGFLRLTRPRALFKRHCRREYPNCWRSPTARQKRFVGAYEPVSVPSEPDGSSHKTKLAFFCPQAAEPRGITSASGARGLQVKLSRCTPLREVKPDHRCTWRGEDPSTDSAYGPLATGLRPVELTLALATKSPPKADRFHKLLSST